MPSYYRITAPGRRLVHGPFQLDQPDTFWFVHGVAYLDAETYRRFPDYFRQRGYTVEADQIPPDNHFERVAAMEAQDPRRPAVAVQDGAEPGPRFNYPRFNN
ncbi:hypothetical protein HUO13_02480 [Saccharopolyspora erythraea]|uniref:hypothetical protein n=1 Tax=Saccharopolyspora erythraea TaxID=1836 RepID=UPI001BA7B366|nr:hypothetical protein [Saccharopolyspora erythraea]QUG99817.1 hypothetical protein HUO13_02480 [Saccharopolyspora erythraea]